MKPVYETERRSTRLWLIPVVIFAFFMVGIGAVVLPIAALRAQAATARRAWAAEAREAQLVAQLGDELPKPTVRSKESLTLIDDTAKSPPVVKWEYKTTNANTNTMNQAGDEGWELVSVSPYNNGNDTRAYFKRPLRAAATAVDPKRGEERPHNSQSDSQEPPAELMPEVNVR